MMVVLPETHRFAAGPAILPIEMELPAGDAVIHATFSSRRGDGASAEPGADTAPDVPTGAAGAMAAGALAEDVFLDDDDDGWDEF